MATSILQGINEVIQAITDYTSQEHVPDLSDIISRLGSISAELGIIATHDDGPNIDGVALAITSHDAGPHIDNLGTKIDILTTAVNCTCEAINRLVASQEAAPYEPSPAPTLPVDPPDPTNPAPGDHLSWDSYYCGAGQVLCDVIANYAETIGGLGLAGMVGATSIIAAASEVWEAATGNGYTISISAIANLVQAVWAVIVYGFDVVLGTAATPGEISSQFRSNGTLRACVSRAMRDGEGWVEKRSMVRDAIASEYDGEHGLSIALAMVFSQWVQELTNGHDVDGVTQWIETPVGTPCSCLPESEIELYYTFENGDTQGWIRPDPAIVTNGVMHVLTDIGTRGNDIKDYFGLPTGSYNPVYIAFDFYPFAPAGGFTTAVIQLRVNEWNIEHLVWEPLISDYDENTWHRIEIDLTGLFAGGWRELGDAFEFRIQENGEDWSDGRNIWIDNITILANSA